MVRCRGLNKLMVSKLGDCVGTLCLGAPTLRALEGESPCHMTNLGNGNLIINNNYIYQNCTKLLKTCYTGALIISWYVTSRIGEFTDLCGPYSIVYCCIDYNLLNYHILIYICSPISYFVRKTRGYSDDDFRNNNNKKELLITPACQLKEPTGQEESFL